MTTPENLLKQRQPEEFAALAVLHKTAGSELMTRLEWMTLKPLQIAEVGCAVGDCTQQLRERYPDAEIHAFDESSEMLAFNQKKALRNVTWQIAQPHILPLRDHSVDLLVANLTLSWCADFKVVLEEWRRVLRQEGLLMFTSLGPDTLRELRDVPLQLPHLMDMHNVGDCLTQTGFLDPVLDVDYFTLVYRSEAQLFHELKVTGMAAGETREMHLTSEGSDPLFPLTCEVVFGHAFGAGARSGYSADESGEVRIPVSHILRR